MNLNLKFTQIKLNKAGINFPVFKLNIMGKIKLLKRLWNTEKGKTIDVNAEREEFAIRRGYAEPVGKKPEKKVEKVKREKKIEGTTREKKQNFVGNKSVK